MKKLIATLALGASVLAAAAPASAQSYRADRYDDRYDRGGRWNDTGFHPTQLRPRLDRISWQISQGMQRGRLTPGEAARLRAEHRHIWQVATNYYRSNGVNQRELRDIDYRIDRLQQRLRFERRDDDRRYWR
jgi:hypothetical protein